MAIYDFTGANGSAIPADFIYNNGTFEIQSNAITPVGADPLGAKWVTAVESASDGTFIADVTIDDASTASGIVFRLSDISNFLMFIMQKGTSVGALYTNIAGTLTLVSSSAMPFIVGSTQTLKVVTLGSNIKCYINDGLYIDTNVAFNSGATGAGFRFNKVTGSADNLNVPDAAVSSITVDAVDEFRPYTVSTSDFSVAFSGTNAGAVASTAIERKIVYDDDGTTVAGFDWLEYVPAASVTDPSGAWSGAVITLPASIRKYRAQFRFSDDIAKTTESSSFFSGYHITLTGQSLGNFLYTNGAGSASTGVYYGNGSTGAITTPSVGAGAIALGNAITAHTSLPVLITNSCVGGLAIIQNNQGSAGFYLYDPTTPTSYYNTLLLQITRFNGVNSVINVQFEQDAKLLAGTFADVKAGFQGLVAKIRTDTGLANLPFIMSCLGTRGAGITSDANIFGMRDIQKEISDADANMVYINKYDLPVDQTDGLFVHLTTAGNITHGQRLAAAIKNQVLGDTSAWESGKVTSVVQTTPTNVVFNIAHAQGADFTPTSAITDITLSTDGVTFSEVPSAVVRTNATSFTATVTSGTYTNFRYNYKALPDLSGVILDNSTLALPLDSTNGAVVDGGLADTTAPVITLTGASTINLDVGDTYTELGATALDNIDGDITANIVTTGTVNTAIAGNYTKFYNVSDAALNPAIQVTRNIIVSAVVIPGTPPTANAGVDQVGVPAGTIKSFDFSGTTKDVVDWDITQIAGDRVYMGGFGQDKVFIVPTRKYGQTLTFQLSVTNGYGLTDTDTVNFEVLAKEELPLLAITVESVVEGEFSRLRGLGYIGSLQDMQSQELLG